MEAIVVMAALIALGRVLNGRKAHGLETLDTARESVHEFTFSDILCATWKRGVLMNM
jgi:hypothetical protein